MQQRTSLHFQQSSQSNSNINPSQLIENSHFDSSELQTQSLLNLGKRSTPPVSIDHLNRQIVQSENFSGSNSNSISNSSQNSHQNQNSTSVSDPDSTQNGSVPSAHFAHSEQSIESTNTPRSLPQTKHNPIYQSTQMDQTIQMNQSIHSAPNPYQFHNPYHLSHKLQQPPQPKFSKEIFEYTSPHPIYAVDWSTYSAQGITRLAVGSDLQTYENYVNIVELADDQRFDSQEGLQSVAQFKHPYAPTALEFAPSQNFLQTSLYAGLADQKADFLASTGDFLRIWRLNTLRKIEMVAIFQSPQQQLEFCSPITCIDWCPIDPLLILTGGIDTTCSVWDLQNLQSKTQLIAHDKEVLDVSWAKGSKEVFASSSTDGSLRLFDLRRLQHSTILYETKDKTPIVKLEWNNIDSNYLSILGLNNSNCFIIDIRSPTIPVTQLSNHVNAVNSVQWAPHSSHHLCTGGADGHY